MRCFAFATVFRFVGFGVTGLSRYGEEIKKMYKNQLQELAQRSCFNLPSYACTREGPDHAPRFKACVNFNGEVFESPIYSPTLRQAEHSAAEVALNVLSTRGPSSSLTARVLDETGVYKNLLQETAHRAGLKLPVYTTVRSGPGHVPVFTCSVELAGMKFSGEPAKTKKQAEKNAAIAAWSTLKTRPYLVSLFETGKYAAESSRDENQGGRMMMGMRGQSPKGKNIGGLCTSKLRNYPHNDQQRNLLNPNYSPSSSATTSTTCCNLYEVGGGSGISSSSTCNKKQSTSLGSSSFVSLLPPPKPRTTSKILPPELVQVKMQEVLDEHQRDEDEWLRGSKCSNPPHAYNNRSSRRGFSIQEAIPEGNYRQVGGLKYKNICAKGMAPAVQIRSVIPVCAAAPARAPQPHQDLPLVVEEEAGADANKNDDASAIH